MPQRSLGDRRVIANFYQLDSAGSTPLPFELISSQRFKVGLIAAEGADCPEVLLSLMFDRQFQFG